MPITISNTLDKIEKTLYTLHKDKTTGKITVVYEIDMSQGAIGKATIDVKTDLMAEGIGND